MFVGIEIIPNWHPFFVHFTIAMLTVGPVLYLLAFIAGGSWRAQSLTTATWLLWIGGAITIFTLLFGWQAFNSVTHDGPSHRAMLDHRMFALITGGLLLVSLGLLYFFRAASRPSPIAAVALVAMTGMLMATGLKGADLVYRHGLGVMSLPKGGAHDHGAHNHEANGHDHEENAAVKGVAEEKDDHDHDGHDHGAHDHDADKSNADKGSADKKTAKPVEAEAPKPREEDTPHEHGPGEDHAH